MAATVERDGKWYVKDLDANSPWVYCASQAIAQQLLAAALAGGSWELTFRIAFGVESEACVAKLKKL